MIRVFVLLALACAVSAAGPDPPERCTDDADCAHKWIDRHFEKTGKWESPFFGGYEAEKELAVFQEEKSALQRKYEDRTRERCTDDVDCAERWLARNSRPGSGWPALVAGGACNSEDEACRQRVSDYFERLQQERVREKAAIQRAYEEELARDSPGHFADWYYTLYAGEAKYAGPLGQVGRTSERCTDDADCVRKWRTRQFEETGKWDSQIFGGHTSSICHDEACHQKDRDEASRLYQVYVNEKAALQRAYEAEQERRRAWEADVKDGSGSAIYSGAESSISGCESFIHVPDADAEHVSSEGFLRNNPPFHKSQR